MDCRRECERKRRRNWKEMMFLDEVIIMMIVGKESGFRNLREGGGCSNFMVVLWV